MPHLLLPNSRFLIAYLLLMSVTLVPALLLGQRRAKRRRHVAWSVRNTAVFREGETVAPGVRISVDRAAGSLSLARVAIWNPVPYYTAQALSPSNPDFVSYEVSGARPDVQILDARVLQEFVTDGTVTSRAGFNHQQADIRMPPLRGQRGAVLQVTHTGSNADDLRVTTNDPSIPLKSYAPSAVHLNQQRPNKRLERMNRASRTLPNNAVLLLVLTIVGFGMFVAVLNVPAVGRFFHAWDYATPFIVLASLVVHVRSRRKQFEPKVALPRELSSFFEG